MDEIGWKIGGERLWEPTLHQGDDDDQQLFGESSDAHGVVRVAMTGGARKLRIVLAAVFATPALAAPVVFHVNLGQASATPVSGRLLVFAKALAPTDKRPGATVELDADVTAFPTAFSQLKPGRYAVQTVLDRDHSYNYTGRGPLTIELAQKMPSFIGISPIRILQLPLKLPRRLAVS